MEKTIPRYSPIHWLYSCGYHISSCISHWHLKLLFIKTSTKSKTRVQVESSESSCQPNADRPKAIDLKFSREVSIVYSATPVGFVFMCFSCNDGLTITVDFCLLLHWSAFGEIGRNWVSIDMYFPCAKEGRRSQRSCSRPSLAEK